MLFGWKMFYYVRHRNNVIFHTFSHTPRSPSAHSPAPLSHESRSEERIRYSLSAQPRTNCYILSLSFFSFFLPIHLAVESFCRKTIKIEFFDRKKVFPAFAQKICENFFSCYWGENLFDFYSSSNHRMIEAMILDCDEKKLREGKLWKEFYKLKMLLAHRNQTWIAFHSQVDFDYISAKLSGIFVVISISDAERKQFHCTTKCKQLWRLTTVLLLGLNFLPECRDVPAKFFRFDLWTFSSLLTFENNIESDTSEYSSTISKSSSSKCFLMSLSTACKRNFSVEIQKVLF